MRSTTSSGALVFLPLNLGDANKVKEEDQSFLVQEQGLDILFNLTGVMVSSEEPLLRTTQGYVPSIGINYIERGQGCGRRPE